MIHFESDSQDEVKLVIKLRKSLILRSATQWRVSKDAQREVLS